ncbi:hypothetical protein DPMN_014735 [Dreissena polymorpha]|uniref:Uncharacterized protein n=1 Tax=Dreissena polymorpha TaxID=45954 RepID=A0A9D4NA82_DREPO|nr:hypothetical protein DPMN_014735 [Dreissena polymorpha]
MVSIGIVLYNLFASQVTETSGPTVSSAQQHGASPQLFIEDGRGDYIPQSLSSWGVSQRAAEIALSAYIPGTRNQYRLT